MTKNNRINKVLNPHLTMRGATAVDGNDRVARAYRDHQPSGPAKDIFDRVSEVSTRNYGLSASTSGGRRPSHKAQSSAGGSGIDKPDTAKWRRFKDWA